MHQIEFSGFDIRMVGLFEQMPGDVDGCLIERGEWSSNTERNRRVHGIAG